VIFHTKSVDSVIEGFISHSPAASGTQRSVPTRRYPASIKTGARQHALQKRWTETQLAKEKAKGRPTTVFPGELSTTVFPGELSTTVFPGEL
jgi:hypothetical protein